MGFPILGKSTILFARDFCGTSKRSSVRTAAMSSVLCSSVPLPFVFCIQIANLLITRHLNLAFPIQQHTFCSVVFVASSPVAYFLGWIVLTNQLEETPVSSSWLVFTVFNDRSIIVLGETCVEAQSENAICLQGEIDLQKQGICA